MPFLLNILKPANRYNELNTRNFNYFNYINAEPGTNNKILITSFGKVDIRVTRILYNILLNILRNKRP